MKSSQLFLVCLAFLGSTQLGKSQVKRPAAIPGYLDPATGKFTTQLAPAAAEQAAQPNAAAATGTSVFFREVFSITIQNYDQSANSNVVCAASITTYESGSGYSYTDVASVTASPYGNGFTCNVPVLTTWTLNTPASDSISVTLTVTSVPSGASTNSIGPGRTSFQTFTIAVPGNSQTVYNNALFTL